MTDLLKKDVSSLLLIEDDREDSLLLMEMISSTELKSFQIQEVETMAKAEEVLGKQSFDIIITDLNLPDSRGLTTLESLLAVSENTPIIVLTGLSDQEVGIQAISFGAQDYLVKGNFRGDQLVKSVTYAIKRKSAEDSLRQSEERFRKLAENIQDGIIILEDKEVAFVNSRMCEITGYDEDEIKKMTVFQLAAPEESVRLEKSLATWRTTGVWPEILSFWIARKDGERRYLRNAFSEVVNGKRMIFITSTDLTEAKVASQTLQEREQFLGRLINSTPNSVIYTDLDGNILEYNKAADEMFGISDKNKQPKINIWDRIPESKIETVESYMHSTIVEGSIYDGPTVFLNKELESFPAKINAAVVKGKEGSLVGIVGIIRDITEEQKAERALLEAKRKAEMSDNLKTAFLANISHEIRTPMNAIMGLSDVLRDDDLQLPERKEYIDIIHKNSQDLLRIINDIVDISIIDTQQIRLNPEHFDVNALIEEIIVSSEVDLNPDIELILDHDRSDQNAELYADKGKLKQVLRNLVGNGIKFTEKGHVKIGCHLNEKNIEIWVEDNGVGIENDKQGEIFERFYKINDNTNLNRGGTGLGLSICKEFITKMSGEILLDSSPGKGSRFSVVLPIEPSKVNIEETDEATPETNSLDNKTVLVAEDEMTNFTYIETILKRSNIKAIHALNGKEALSALSNGHNIDLVLMDVGMPVMNGLEATKAIREAGSEIPIVAVTAYAFPEDKIKCMNAGCNDFLSKPVKPDTLIDVIIKNLKLQIPG